MNRAVYFGAAALVAAAVMLPVADRVATFAPGASMQQPAVGASDAGDADPAKPCFGPVTNGITIRCGRLQVPEDYAEPDGRAVTFGYMRLRPAVVDSSAPPLYFVDGGPGTGTTGAADFYPSFWLEWVKNVGLQRELILFDQRGVGASVPSLNCTELDEPVARANLSRDGRTFPGFAELSDAALKACRARLIAEGVAIDQYNSNNIIRDMERLRAHLGHDRIALIGVSNGTRIALKYLRQYSAVVDAVVLDSVAPPDVAISREYLFSFMTSFRRMAEVCQEQPTCAARYPDPVDLLARALQRLEEKPIDVAVENRRGGAPYVLRVDDLTLFDLLFDMAYGVSGYERMLSIIASIAEGREPELGSIATHFVHDGVLNPALYEGAYWSIDCADEFDAAATGPLLARLRADPLMARWAVDYWYRAPCSYWGMTPRPADERAAVVSGVPTLLLADFFDPVTPPDYARHAARTLANAQVHVFRYGGHTVSFSHPCAYRMIREFLRAPMTRVDAACVAEVKPRVFDVAE